jgi:hypothetical protein
MLPSIGTPCLSDALLIAVRVATFAQTQREKWNVSQIVTKTKIFSSLFFLFFFLYKLKARAFAGNFYFSTRAACIAEKVTNLFFCSEQCR